MSLTWCVRLLSVALVLYADTCDGAVPSCKFKWFASQCRFRCHCVNNDCDVNGECIGSSYCDKGWFGPSCQYVDLVTTNTNSSTPDWVYDFPDTDCNPGQETVTVSLNDVFFFTWLRLRVSSSVLSQDLKVQLMSANGSSVECGSMYTLKINDTTLDVHCQPGAFFQQVNITGDGVKSLCSVYISGGRNVALGQETTQISNSYYTDSTFAVDGDTNPKFGGKSCTHTKEEENPYWKLTFEFSHQVYRYIIYNRDAERQRLRGFSLEAFQPNNSIAFDYTDPTKTDHDKYRIQSTSPLTPISNVTIVRRYGSEALTLCEVEMFGDAACPAGQYGRECKNRCNCAKDGENCFVSTGGCPSGCAAGFHREECSKRCDEKYFGIDCLQNCSISCRDQYCQPANGTCLSCIAGKQGPLCDADCDPTFWGDNCTKSCSVDCKNQLCNPVNGTCFSCVAGKFGDSCSEACNATHYGENCPLPCSSNCAVHLCNATNENCQSCVTGNSGLLCDEACSPTMVGKDCNETCRTNCTSRLCDAVTGKCASCVQGFDGDYCDHMMLLRPLDDSPPVAAIVGPVVAFVVLTALIVTGVMLWRRRRHKKDAPGQATPHGFNSAEMDSIQIAETKSARKKSDKAANGKVKAPVTKNQNGIRAEKDGPVNHTGGAYYNQVTGRSETAIRFDDLDHFMSIQRSEFFKEQFNRIPANSSVSTTVALSPENVNKNRYKNISAYDHSRVHLQTDVLKNHGDYINASYIDGYQQKKQFIASQGATKIILEDFVRMLWEQEVEVVVMLTSLVEDGKLKCEQYWPDDGEITIGEVTVKLTTTQVFADYTIRRLCLYKKVLPVQVLRHFHFTTWPDKDIPTTAWGLVDLEQRMAAIFTSKPIVVHCSAGVGRTGTFIALHNTLEQIKHTGYMDVFTTVQKLRQDRINMVQTCRQYEFLHKAVQIAMVCKGTTVTTRDIRDRIQTLELSESGQSNLEREFKSVCMVCCEEEQQQPDENEEVLESNTYCNSRLLTNRMKNRLDNVLPNEYFRPKLICETEQLENYINAVLIPSCEKHEQQILNQLPLPTTAIDFWRLVTQYKVTVIVAFERDLSTVDTTIADYLPETEGETKTCSFFNIKTTGLDSLDCWDVHRITISVSEENASKIANMPIKGEYKLSHLSWNSKNFDSKNLLVLMEKIRSMKPPGEGRTLFMCRNGAELSGLACTMSLLLDRIDNDQHVSVPLVVGTLKAIRPQIIPTLDQYRLLYQTLNLFNETNNEYSNVSVT